MLNGIENSGENKSNALGALVLEKADSFGIAHGFKVICDESEIPCIYAEGSWYICNITSDKIMTKLADIYTLENPSYMLMKTLMN